MAEYRVYYSTGWTVLDDDTRTATEYTDTGFRSPPRPYTERENAEADDRALTVQQEANRQSIEAALADALATLQAIIDTPNSTINSSPAPYIKDLARASRRQIRLLIRRLDGTS